MPRPAAWVAAVIAGDRYPGPGHAGGPICPAEVIAMDRYPEAAQWPSVAPATRPDLLIPEIERPAVLIATWRSTSR